MIDVVIAFVVGIVVGSCVGMVIAGLCVGSARNEEQEERDFEKWLNEINRKEE